MNKTQTRIEAMHAASRFLAGVYAGGNDVTAPDIGPLSPAKAVVLLAEDLVQWIEKGKIT